MLTCEVRRGATARFLLKDAALGSVEGWQCVADIRMLTAGARSLTGNERIAATFDVAEYEHAGEPVGWFLTLDDDTTAALAPGVYIADARMSLPGGDVAVTESWTMRLIEPATVPA